MTATQTTWYTYNTQYSASYIMFPPGFGGWITIPTNATTIPSAPVPISFDFDFDLALPVEKQCKVKVGNAEGYECSDCSDFYPFAELNQPDNAQEFTRFTCYSCRKGLKTIFGK